MAQFPPITALTPKKSHTVRNVLLVLGGLFLLGIAGFMALVVAAGSEVSRSLEESLEPVVAEAGDTVPTSAGPTPTSLVETGTPSVPPNPTGKGPKPVGTRSNPGQIGQPFTLRDRDNGDFDVTVNSFDKDAWPEIAATNQFNDPAAPGTRYVMMNITVVYHEGLNERAANAPLFSLGLAAFGSAGQERSSTDCMAVVPGELDIFAELLDGGTASGNVCFVVDEAEATGPILFRATEDFCFSNCDEAWIKVQ